MPEFPTHDSELLNRFRAGDREAFTLLYRRHQTAVFRFAMLMTGDYAKATEITQDVFVWLVHHAGNFDPARGELGSFLAGVTRKYLLKRRGEELRWAPLDDSFASVEFEGEARDGKSADAEALRRAVLALPDKYRERRRAVLNAAYSAHPERFVRKPPQPLQAPKEVWINKPQPTPENKTQ